MPPLNPFLNNLKRQAEENPVAAVGVGAVAVQAVTKLLNAYIANKNSNAWKTEVARRALKAELKKKS